MILAFVLASTVVMAAGDADLDQVNQVALPDASMRVLTAENSDEEESNETSIDDEEPTQPPSKPSPKPSPTAGPGKKLVPAVVGSATLDGDRDEICTAAFMGA